MARKRLPGRLNLLTVRLVMTAAAGDHSDGGGLILRVDDTASARWVLRFTSPAGRRREMGLGAAFRDNASIAGDSLVRARKAASEARDLLAEDEDPIDARASKRKAAKQLEANKRAKATAAHLTLLRAARAYHERVVEPNRTSKHSKQWIASIEGPPPGEERPQWRAKLDALLPLPVAAVTGPALLDAVSDMQAAVPETASRVRQRLEAIFDDCEFRGLCGSNPARAIRRKLREAGRTRDRGRFAALPYVEAPAFFASLQSQRGVAARALEFAMLTAARTGEVIGANWAEVDLQSRVWTVPGERMKGGEPHVVHLVPRAVEILQGQAELGTTFVFPAPDSVGTAVPAALSNMAMLSLLRRMDADKRTTVHGLCRSTFSTWAYETGSARPDVIEACLAHQEQDRVKRAYNRAEFIAERQRLLLRWAEYLTGSKQVPNRKPSPQREPARLSIAAAIAGHNTGGTEL